MAKHRRTREEKKIADQRHLLYHLETSTAPVNSPSEKSTSEYKLETSIPRTNIATSSYAYVTKDLRKTAVVTAAIIVAQIFLFIVLNRI